MPLFFLYRTQLQLVMDVLILNSNYPLGLMPLATQIAGHGSEGDGKRPILKREDGKILKPIQPPPKGPREANFYLGQDHHMFSRFLNLQIFSRNFLCFVFNQDRGFLLRSKIQIKHRISLNNVRGH